MTLERIDGVFTVCKAVGTEGIDLTLDFCFVGKTDGELSLVCPTEHVPDKVTAREDGWRAFRVRGCLDFSLVGVLSGISAVLAEEGIGIFVVSTYDTDYVFVKEESYDRALDALSRKGYVIV